MKRLSLYLFLILFTLQTPSWADDIRDFQIEGMSIGDSLLDYFTEEQIKKNTFPSNNGKSFFRVKKFNIVDFYKHGTFKIYDNIQFMHKTSDKKYIIYYIAGDVDFPNDIKKCLKKKKEVIKIVSSDFNNLKRTDGTYKHKADKSGKSKVHETRFHLKSGESIELACYEYSKEFEKKNNTINYFRLSVTTNEVIYFLKNEAY
jgi:hypothetical protein